MDPIHRANQKINEQKGEVHINAFVLCVRIKQKIEGPL
jgi:hypothetical protein